MRVRVAEGRVSGERLTGPRGHWEVVIHSGDQDDGGVRISDATSTDSRPGLLCSEDLDALVRAVCLRLQGHDCPHNPTLPAVEDGTSAPAIARSQCQACQTGQDVLPLEQRQGKTARMSHGRFWPRRRLRGQMPRQHGTHSLNPICLLPGWTTSALESCRSESPDSHLGVANSTEAMPRYTR